ncbi:MAG: hypothetical protein IT184_04540 [Acidobacteria bacterium]|nr:hypothetical protein [Acidobacteriota bacterium]
MDPSVTIAVALLVPIALAIAIAYRKGRRLPGAHVFRASRLSKGNRVFPAQVLVTPDSITLYQPQWVGRIEESIHIAHVSSIRIDTNLVFSDVFIETTGGHSPIVCHGHTKGDAVKMKALIEKFQTERYGRQTPMA